MPPVMRSLAPVAIAFGILLLLTGATTYVQEVVPVVADPPPPYGLITGSLFAGGTLLLAGLAERA